MRNTALHRFSPRVRCLTEQNTLSANVSFAYYSLTGLCFYRFCSPMMYISFRYFILFNLLCIFDRGLYYNIVMVLFYVGIA
jgi:hypothetical protein